MTGATGPQPGQPVEYLPAIGIGIVSTLGRHHESWLIFELAVAGEWHPVGFEFFSTQSHCGFLF